MATEFEQILARGRMVAELRKERLWPILRERWARHAKWILASWNLYHRHVYNLLKLGTAIQYSAVSRLELMGIEAAESERTFQRHPRPSPREVAGWKQKESPPFLLFLVSASRVNGFWTPAGVLYYPSNSGIID